VVIILSAVGVIGTLPSVLVEGLIVITGERAEDGSFPRVRWRVFRFAFPRSTEVDVGPLAVTSLQEIKEIQVEKLIKFFFGSTCYLCFIARFFTWKVERTPSLIIIFYSCKGYKNIRLN